MNGLFLDALSAEEQDMLVERGSEIFNSAVEETLSQTDPKLYEDLVKFFDSGKGEIAFGLFYADDLDEQWSEILSDFDPEVQKTLYVLEVEVGYGLDENSDNAMVLAQMLLSADDSVTQFHIDWLPFDERSRLQELIAQGKQMQ